MNIVFQTPEGIAVTELGEATDSREHARFLMTLQGFEGWLPVAYDRPAEFFPNRDFQGAWVWDGSALSVDIPKAREITADRLRAERIPALEALDLEYMRTLEKGGDTMAVVQKKQALRDFPEKVKFCSTLEELIALHI